MNFSLGEDLTALLDSLDKVLAATPVEPTNGKRSFFNGALDAALEESGLLDAAGMDEFGTLGAAHLVERIARHPVVVEAGASAFLRPLMCPDWPRPLAVVHGDGRRPARFLPQARSVAFIGDTDVRLARLEAGDVEAVGEFFTYPMGRLVNPDACFGRSERVGDAAEARRLLSIAAASEIAGALQGGLESVTDHVKNRRQFGRPLGSFQAIQHRLARDASDITAIRMLSLKAAALGDNDNALIALGFAQDVATRIMADLHQFMGATGLTLEHPLYIWTYRVKLLATEFGGAHTQYRNLSESLWNSPGTDAAAPA